MQQPKDEGFMMKPRLMANVEAQSASTSYPADQNRTGWKGVAGWLLGVSQHATLTRTMHLRFHGTRSAKSASLLDLSKSLLKALLISWKFPDRHHKLIGSIDSPGTLESLVLHVLRKTHVPILF